MAKKTDWDQQVGRRLKLRDLHIFLTVARCGSMAKAAAELGIAQPVVSTVIAGLEHVIGVRLLDRSSRGVEPTPYGRALLDGGGMAIDELKQTMRKIEFLADPTAGELRIGCPETISALLPPACQAMARKCRHVVFHVADVAAPTFDLPQLRDRSLDIVVLRVRWPFPEDTLMDELNIEELFDDETVVVAGVESRWARRRKINLADLLDEDWILPPANTTNSIVLMDAFRAQGLRLPRVSFVSFSVTLRTSLLASGRYLSVMPRSMMRLYADRMHLKVLPVKLAERRWPVVIVTLKNRTLNPLVSVFVDHLHASVKALNVTTSR
jgi:DNA-binding transcriptional LysR family regulator